MTGGLNSLGNLAPTADFRAVYSSILEQWLKADANAILPNVSGYQRPALAQVRTAVGRGGGARGRFSRPGAGCEAASRSASRSPPRSSTTHSAGQAASGAAVIEFVELRRGPAPFSARPACRRRKSYYKTWSMQPGRYFDLLDRARSRPLPAVVQHGRSPEARDAGGAGREGAGEVGRLGAGFDRRAARRDEPGGAWRRMPSDGHRRFLLGRVTTRRPRQAARCHAAIWLTSLMKPLSL